MIIPDFAAISNSLRQVGSEEGVLVGEQLHRRFVTTEDVKRLDGYSQRVCEIEIPVKRMLSSWGLLLRKLRISRVRSMPALRMRILNSRGGRLETATLPSSSGRLMVKVPMIRKYEMRRYGRLRRLSTRMPNDGRQRRRKTL
jgi:hypothetical protein